MKQQPGCGMSQPVTRYDYEICTCAMGTHLEQVQRVDGEHVSASAYDTIAKQAVEMAKAIQTIIKIRNAPHKLNALGKCTDMWKIAESVSLQAQAIIEQQGGK